MTTHIPSHRNGRSALSEGDLAGASPGVPGGEWMVYRDAVLTIDLSRRAVSVSGRRLELTPTEYRLLLSLVRGRGRVVGRERLVTEVWGPNEPSGDGLKIYIGRLRRKMELDPSRPQLIHTCWGVGYRYEAEGDGRQRMGESWSQPKVAGWPA